MDLIIAMANNFQQGCYLRVYTKLCFGLRMIFLTSIVLLAACGNKWEEMPDDELATKASMCSGMNDPAPAMIQVCKNYERECERRRKSGIYVC